MSALTPCECAVATHTGTLMFEMLLLSRFGPASVAKLNRSIWVRSIHGMFEEGAQPRSTVMTSCPEGEGEGEAATVPGTIPTMTAAMTATARIDAGTSG